MFILCEGKMAEKPYKMPVTRQNIYSLEELCYYIYNNIYTITEEFFQESLAVWLREETDHPALAKKVQNMLSADMKLKDMVVTILCGCDLYKESEIRSLVRVMDEIANLPLHKKKEDPGRQLSPLRTLWEEFVGVPQTSAGKPCHEFLYRGIWGYLAQSGNCPLLCLLFC